ncbi:MAG: hypothetical protein M1533_00250 [Candidatus Thermoplasmatota archaeon]|jgi:hypothetical protein|nr:hypothetical protein [Candidatus Thermoplasmatota archaeon]MCL5794049.1 hypothetical protein [Candidatus Thermoplasmatota archaeon]
MAQEAWERISRRRFPKDYIADCNPGEARDIPMSKEVLLFRKDEFACLMIGENTYYFTNNEEAKYYFYSACSSASRVPFLGIEEMRTANRKFEADLDCLHTDLERIRKINNLSDSEMSEVILQFENLSGIHGLL